MVPPPPSSRQGSATEGHGGPRLFLSHPSAEPSQCIGCLMISPGIRNEFSLRRPNLFKDALSGGGWGGGVAPWTCLRTPGTFLHPTGHLWAGCGVRGRWLRGLVACRVSSLSALVSPVLTGAPPPGGDRRRDWRLVLVTGSDRDRK